MKLSLRLDTIKNMVPYSVACDVGADHGKLIISLVEENKISFGYAIENKKGPFNRLEKAVKESDYKEKITCLLSDGIKDIPDTVSTVIIAGMGGSLIVRILKDSFLKLKHIDTLIIDAHSEIPLVREEISKMGFIIADEKIIEEKNKYYEIIKFIKGSVTFLNDLDKNYGPILRNEKSITFIQKYTERVDQINFLLALPGISEEKYNKLKKEEEQIKSSIL